MGRLGLHLLISLPVLVGGLGACSGASPRAAPPAAGAGQTQAVQIVEVKSGDYFYDPKEITVQPGPISVIHTNQGPKRHTFNVRALDDRTDLVESEQISRGDSITIDFTLLEEGTYRIYCAVTDHAELGEVGTLTVRR